MGQSVNLIMEGFFVEPKVALLLKPASLAKL